VSFHERPYTIRCRVRRTVSDALQNVDFVTGSSFTGDCAMRENI
jgi:hypothetical protein